MDAVVVTNLTKSFGSGPAHRAALKNLSLRLPSGSMTALIGPDGAGKTTLLRTLAAILTPDAGEVRVLGYSPTEEALELQSHVGYMPQHFGLYEDLSVQENLTLFADLHEIPSSVRERRFADLLTMTALGPFRKRLAGKLSGGMKQKLGLACTLVHPPDLLLLDEASVGVDPISRREIWKIIRQQVTDRQITVLLSTAYMDEAERCDHVILLHEGEILAQGSPTQVSEPLQGRSFLLESPESTSCAPRDLQSEIAGLPGVIDAVIQADGLRIVTEQPQPPALPDDVVEQRTLKTVPARLEDAFVSLLFTRPAAVRSPPRAAARQATIRWSLRSATSTATLARSPPSRESASRFAKERSSVCWARMGRVNPQLSACFADCCPPRPEHSASPGSICERRLPPHGPGSAMCPSASLSMRL